MMRIRLWAAMSLPVFFVALATPAEARPIEALAGLEALRAGFAGMVDFSAGITQEKRLSVMRRSLTMTGTVRFKKPDRFYMAINPPYASRTVLKDQLLQQVVGHNATPTRIVLPPEQGLGYWFSKLAQPLTRLPEGLDVQADLTNSLYSVAIRPHGTGQIKEVTIAFQKDGTIRRIAILERSGDKATMTFKNVRRNTGLTDQDFQLSNHE